MNKIVGYFDSYRQTVPAFDPGLDIPCIVDGTPLRDQPRVTVSLAPLGGDRSYFFRAHKDCWDALTPGEQSRYVSSVIDHAQKAPR